eukprot:jgi/Psemu1/309414/fgenesh1_kg.507_\
MKFANLVLSALVLLSSGSGSLAEKKPGARAPTPTPTSFNVTELLLREKMIELRGRDNDIIEHQLDQIQFDLEQREKEVERHDAIVREHEADVDAAKAATAGR